MLISAAYAAGEAVGNPPTAGDAFMTQMFLILILVVLFYVLLIMPQQKRFKKHREMLDSLKKGDKIVTSGGLLGKIDKITPEKDEVIIDLGGDIKVTALRSTIQGRRDPLPANDVKTDTKKDAKKDEGAAEKAPKKKSKDAQ